MIQPLCSRVLCSVPVACALLLGLTAPAAAQEEVLREMGAPQPMGVWPLFVQSFDAFTILLLIGSVAAGAFIFRVLVEIRPGTILPMRRIRAMEDLIRTNRISELQAFVEDDNSLCGAAVRAALSQRQSRDSMREAAELASSENVASWFRRIEPLNIIGNLGPLVGLAGTVWGMIIAFTSLGVAGGNAGPADLSLGISKALFHTLLGLCLAIPCLVVFGFYRGIVDRYCTRAMVIASELVEKLPVREEQARNADAAPVGAGAAGTRGL
jgi:biopolymer transport protein ExbB